MTETILITGANRGIGLAMAKIYAGRGDRVIATVREPGKATALAGLKGVEVHTLDVTAETATAALANKLAGTTIDLVIANAGAYHSRGAWDDPSHTAEAWMATLMTNVVGAFLTARAFVPNLKPSKHGRIAIISSHMGSNGRARGGSYAYRASKAAATNIASNLAVELKPLGIAVASYHPGWVQTDMGGAAADIDPTTSAKGLVQRFDALSLATSGVFETYAGEVLPF